MSYKDSLLYCSCKYVDDDYFSDKIFICLSRSTVGVSVYALGFVVRTYTLCVSITQKFGLTFVPKNWHLLLMKAKMKMMDMKFC